MRPGRRTVGVHQPLHERRTPMETIAHHRHPFATIIVVVAIALSVALLVAAQTSTGASSEHVRVGTPKPTLTQPGEINPWAFNDPETIRSLCGQLPTVDPSVRQQITAMCDRLTQRSGTQPSLRSGTQPSLRSGTQPVTPSRRGV